MDNRYPIRIIAELSEENFRKNVHKLIVLFGSLKTALNGMAPRDYGTPSLTNKLSLPFRKKFKLKFQGVLSHQIEAALRVHQ